AANVGVGPAAASRLSLQTQPASTATAGVAFAPQPVVRIEDAFGNLRNSDSTTVVSAARGLGSGVLQGTTNLTAVNGIVTFTNLSHNVATNITILFSSGTLVSATSSSIAITPAAVAQLAFATQPGNATAGSAFGTQPVLKTQDQFGNNSTLG